MLSEGASPARYPLTIEMDQGTVSGPTTPAAGVLDRRRDPQVGAHDGDRIGHHHGFVGAQVVDLKPSGTLGVRPDGGQDRRGTIAHVQVRLLPAPVAENTQPGRISFQCAVEIEQVAVRVALAEDGDEAKHDRGEAETVRVSTQHALSGQFLGARTKTSGPEKGASSGVGTSSGSPYTDPVDVMRSGLHRRRASLPGRWRSPPCSA